MLFHWRRLGVSLILLPPSLLVLASLAIVVAGLRDDPHAADLAVVPGSKVRPDGQPSQMLKARLDHAVDLYRQGYFKQVLVSGGRGKEGFDEPAVMRGYLETQGIPHDAIIEDDEGYTTWRTAENTARLMRTRHFQSVLVISQYFHLPRCRLAFGKFDIGPVYGSHAPFWSIRDFYSVPREAIGYAAYAMRQAGEPDPLETPE